MRQFIHRHLGTIAVAMITAMIAAGVPATAAIINATKLNGYRANQLTRVATNTAPGFDPGGGTGTPFTTYRNMISTQITAPKAGYLVMVGQTENYYTGGDPIAWINCAIALDGTRIESSWRNYRFSPDSVSQEADCLTQAVWPVGKGLHTVALQGRTGFEPGVSVKWPSVTATFVPFNGKGKVPTPIAPEAPLREPSRDGGPGFDGR